MRTNHKNNLHHGGGIIARMKAEKKKVVMATCLTAVMALMWVRVIVRSEPAAAQAANQINPEALTKKPKPEPVDVSYRQLPVVEGRNDRLTRDIFAADKWLAFKDLNSHNLKDDGVGIDPNTDNAEVIKKLAQQLRLEATVTGSGRLRAVINGQVLTRGQTLLIGEGRKKVEFEVIGIERDTVTLRCNDASVKIKLAQTIVK